MGRQGERTQWHREDRHRTELGRRRPAAGEAGPISGVTGSSHDTRAGRRGPAMMMHIDLSSVLRQTVSCELYSNLVTRPTGAAVRAQIEALLADARERSLTVIDFSHVGMIDFSCADEVVAKLLLRYAPAERTDREAYFLFRGVTDDHWDAIEAVLERHGLALVLEGGAGERARIVGTVNDRERVAWDKVYELGRT